MDFRLICATNIDLEVALREGRLREDLYFRINTITLRVPPLRERTEDIPLLCNHFLSKFNQRYQKSIRSISPAAYHLLIRNRWPGNVRELENAIERAVLVCKTGEITPADLPESDPRGQRRRAQEFTIPPHRTLAEIEKMAILQTLQRTNWNKQEAAQILGLYRPTLYSKMKKHEIRDQPGLAAGGRTTLTLEWTRLWRPVRRELRLWGQAAWRALIGLVSRNDLTHAASIAYYSLLSLFPFLLLLLSILGVVTADEDDRARVLGFVFRYFPTRLDFMTDQLDAFRADSIRIGVAGGLGLVWASLGFFGAVTSAVNEAWGVEKQRSFWKHRLVSFLMLVAATVADGRGVGRRQLHSGGGDVARRATAGRRTVVRGTADIRVQVSGDGAPDGRHRPCLLLHSQRHARGFATCGLAPS